MVAGKLVAHFVGYVVNVENVAHGVGRARDPTGLAGRVAHHAEVGHAAAAGAHDVADVVVGRADDAVHVGLVLAQHGAAVGVGISGRGLRAGAAQEHQLVVVGDEHHAHSQLLFIHANYAVHGGHLAGHYASQGVAFGEGVFGGVGQGQAVGAQLRAARTGQRAGAHPGGKATRIGLEVGDGGGKIAAGGWASGRPVHVFAIEAEVMPGIGPAHGVDVEAVAAAGQHLGMEAQRREVETHRGRGIVDAYASVGFDTGKAGRQRGGHHGGFVERKAAGAAIGQRQHQHQRHRPRRGFSRGCGQGCTQAGDVQRQGPGVKQGRRQWRSRRGRPGRVIRLKKL